MSLSFLISEKLQYLPLNPEAVVWYDRMKWSLSTELELRFLPSSPPWTIIPWGSRTTTGAARKGISQLYTNLAHRV